MAMTRCHRVSNWQGAVVGSWTFRLRLANLSSMGMATPSGSRARITAWRERGRNPASHVGHEANVAAHSLKLWWLAVFVWTLTLIG